MSKVGLHVIQGSRTGYGDLLRRVHDAGKSLAVVKCVDDFAPAREAKDILGPNVTTVGRINRIYSVDLQGFQPVLPDGSYRSAVEIAAWYYDFVRVTWSSHPNVDIWETFNEMSAHWGWQGEFYSAMMNLAERDGFRLAHYACSSGNPPNAEAIAEMVPCLRETMRRGHYLSLHEYGGVGTDIQTLRGTEPFHALRHRWLHDQLPADARPHMLITECGQAGGFNFLGTDTLLADLRWYDAELMAAPYVQCAAVFTLGNWFNANFEAALPALAEYLATAPVIPPPPPPPPARPRGAPRTQYEREYWTYPSDITEEEYSALALKAFRESRITIGGSYDDACVGDLDVRKSRFFFRDPAAKEAEFRAWVEREYPGVQLEIRPLPGSIPEPPPPPLPTPRQPVYIGLHMRADGGDFVAGDWTCIERGRIEAVKVTSGTAWSSLDMLKALGMDYSRCVLRISADMRDPEMSPEKFYNVHVGWLSKWLALGGQYVEVHNEPNLAVEGLGQPWAWNDAEGFANYYAGVTRRIRAWHPAIKIGYPGLSPNSGEVDPRSNVELWLPTIAALIENGLVDWIGAHSYWQTLDQMIDSAYGMYWRRFLRFGMPVMLTEFSNKDAATPRAEKGRQYRMYYADLKAAGEVVAAFAFVSSGTDPEFDRRGETWVLKDGSVSEIPFVVGER